MVDWIKLIISLGASLGIPLNNHHKVQIFAVVACDLLWFYRIKAFHGRTKFDLQHIYTNINKVTMEH